MVRTEHLDVHLVTLESIARNFDGTLHRCKLCAIFLVGEVHICTTARIHSRRCDSVGIVACHELIVGVVSRNEDGLVGHAIGIVDKHVVAGESNGVDRNDGCLHCYIVEASIGG